MGQRARSAGRSVVAFVLDVNAGYGPWLVSAERLFDAMNTGGWAGGLRRGLARFELC